MKDRVSKPGDITTPGVIREHALKVAKELKVTDFKASTRWWQGFRDRNGLTSVPQLHGERAGADIPAATEFTSAFRQTLTNEAWSLQDVYNFDETLMEVRSVDQRNAVRFTDEARAARGTKTDSTRIGVGFCIAADGACLNPIICHTALCPHGWSKADRTLREQQFGFLYHPSHDGWVKTDGLLRWIYNIMIPFARGRCEAAGRPMRALLTLDAAPYHASVAVVLARSGRAILPTTPNRPLGIHCHDFEPQRYPETAVRAPLVAAPAKDEQWLSTTVRERGCDLYFKDFCLAVRFLPGGTTSIIQPCDQGLIYLIKKKIEKKKIQILAETPGGMPKACLAKLKIPQFIEMVAEYTKEVAPEVARSFWKPLLGDLLPAVPPAAEGPVAALAGA